MPIVLVVLSIVFAVVALAGTATPVTPPDGFVLQPVISQRAAYVARKPVNIYCPISQQAWDAYVASGSVGPSNGGDIHGLTPTIGGDTSYIDYAGCNLLTARTHGRSVSLPALGAVLEVLTHESIHLRGESDEGVTDCAASREVAPFIVARWGFRKGSPAYRQLMYGISNFRARTPPIYRAVC